MLHNYAILHIYIYMRYIPIVNDILDELTETIFVQGSESDASAQFQSGADTATVSILDDDGNCTLNSTLR